jgi:phosphoesterase RecJ-like protein
MIRSKGMSDALQAKIRRKIRTSQRVLVTTHVRPDGDAIGSLLGLGLALRQAGKSVQMLSADGVPVSYRHLAGSQDVSQRPEGDFDLTIVLDCSDLNRVGKNLNGFNPPDVNVDHHVTNLLFAKLNLVDTAAVATAEILADNLAGWDLPMTSDVAAALLTGIITDTLGFRTSNMTPKALRLAADLMEAGAALPDLYQRSLVERSFEAMRFWAAGLAKLEREGQIVWATLSMADRVNTGYPGRDDADLINELSAITDAAVSIVFVEQPNGKVKVSWRAQPGIDVSAVALKFGGGGHPSAAGAEVEGSLEDVRQRILLETRQIMQEEMAA